MERGRLKCVEDVLGEIVLMMIAVAVGEVDG